MQLISNVGVTAVRVTVPLTRSCKVTLDALALPTLVTVAFRTVELPFVRWLYVPLIMDGLKELRETSRSGVSV